MRNDHVLSEHVKSKAAKRDEHLRAKPPPVGSVHFDEQLLRKLFQKMERGFDMRHLSFWIILSTKKGLQKDMNIHYGSLNTV